MLGRNGPDAVNSSDYSSPLIVFNKMSFLTEQTEGERVEIKRR